MKKTNAIMGLLAILIAAAEIAGCSDDGSARDPGPGQIFNQLPPNNGGGTTIPGATPTPTPIPFTPNQTFNFEVTGSSGEASTWNSGPISDVDTMLRIRIHADAGGQVSDPRYSNFALNIGCLQFRISIRKADDPAAVPVGITTPLLIAENASISACQGAAQQVGLNVANEYVHDFSGAISGQTGPFELVVSHARYDYYCQLYPTAIGYDPYYGSYNLLGSFTQNCPVRNVFQNHTVGGTIEAQSNRE